MPRVQRYIAILLLPCLLGDAFPAPHILTRYSRDPNPAPLFSAEALSARAWLSGRRPAALWDAFQTAGHLHSAIPQPASSLSIRRSLLAAIPITLLTAPRLLAQVLETEPTVVLDQFNALVRSKKPVDEILQTLFRESARQWVEMETRKKAGDTASMEGLVRNHTYQTRLIHKVVREFPIADKRAMIKTLMQLLLSTSHPAEQSQILAEIQNRIEAVPDGLPSVEVEWGRELSRALLRPELNAEAVSLLKVWVVRDIGLVALLLRERVFAHFSQNLQAANILKMAILEVVTPQMLLDVIINNYGDPAVVFEALQLMTELPADSITLGKFREYSLVDLLSDSENRTLALELLGKLWSQGAFTPETPKTAEDYQYVRFGIRGLTWEIPVTEGMTGAQLVLPDMEGSRDARTRVLNVLLQQIADAETSRDYGWARDTVRPIVATILKEFPDAVKGLIAGVTEDHGTDMNRYAVEEIVTEALQSLSDDAIRGITIHDPRLIVALLRMKQRLNPATAAAAQRALRLITMDSTDEAEAALRNNGIEHDWILTTPALQQDVEQMVELIVQTGGEFDHIVRRANERVPSLVPLLDRMRTYLDSKPQTIGGAMGLAAEYQDIKQFTRRLNDVFNGERNPARRRALARFLDTANRDYRFEYSVRTTKELISDLADPRYAPAAAGLLSRLPALDNPAVFRSIWFSLRPALVNGLASGNLESNAPLQAVLADIMRRLYGSDLVLFEVLKHEDNPELLKWILSYDEPKALSAPKLIVWMADRAKDPELSSVALQWLEHADEVAISFVDELLILRGIRLEATPARLERWARVWMFSLNPSAAGQALGWLDSHRHSIVSENDPENPSKNIVFALLSALDRSLGDPELSIRQQAVNAASRASFKDGMPRFWIEELLHLRLLAVGGGEMGIQKAIERVITAHLQSPLRIDILKTIARTSLDKRLRESAEQVLNSLGFVPRSGIEHIGFVAGAVALTGKIQDPQRMSRRAFFGARQVKPSSTPMVPNQPSSRNLLISA